MIIENYISQSSGDQCVSAFGVLKDCFGWHPSFFPSKIEGVRKPLDVSGEDNNHCHQKETSNLLLLNASHQLRYQGSNTNLQRMENLHQ